MNKLSRMTEDTDGESLFIGADLLTACEEKFFLHEERNI